MKKKALTAIFVVITAINNNNLCMETQKKDLKQLLVIKPNDNYRELINILSKNVVDNRYSSIHPDQQYKMLKTCIDKNNMQCLFLCLQHQFNPNRYHKGLSLLHHAIEQNNFQALWFLAEANPDLVPLNEAGQTPLDYAISLKNLDCSYVMSRIIRMKHNDITLRKEHCGLTKHILKPERPCLRCVADLSCQLQLYGLSYMHCSETSSTATDADSSNAVADYH